MERVLTTAVVEFLSKGFEKVRANFATIRNLATTFKPIVIPVSIMTGAIARAKSLLGSLRDKVIRIKTLFVGERKDEKEKPTGNIGHIGSMATRGLGAATAAMGAFARAASPVEFERFQLTLFAISVQLGRIFVPILRSVTEGLQSVVVFLASMTDQTRETILAWTKAGVAVLVGIVAFTKLTSVLSGVMSVVSSLSTVFAFLGPAAPIGVILALAGAIVGLTSAFDLSGTGGNGFSGILATVKGAISDLWNALQPLISSFVRFAQQIIPAILSAFLPLVQELVRVAQEIFPVLVAAVQPVFAALMGLTTSILPTLVSALVPVVAFIGELASSLLPVFASVLEAVMGILGPILSVLSDLAAVVLPVLAVALKPVIWLFDALAVVMKPIAGLCNLVGKAINFITSPLSALASMFTANTSAADGFNRRLEAMTQNLQALASGGQVTARSLEAAMGQGAEGQRFLEQFRQARTDEERAAIVQQGQATFREQLTQAQQQVGGTDVNERRTAIRTELLQGGAGFALSPEQLNTEVNARVEPLIRAQNQLATVNQLANQGNSVGGTANKFSGDVKAPKTEFSGILEAFNKIQQATSGEDMAAKQLQVQQNQASDVSSILQILTRPGGTNGAPLPTLTITD